ncbi:MAG: DUF4430 domain-containing protein [Eubacterium sp.]|nr:DUF4430 domain-containing protein [Candidatus Colimonas fimequi]
MKNLSKRSLSVLLVVLMAVVMMFAAVGCGASDQANDEATLQAQVETTVTETEETSETTEATTETTTEKTTEATTKATKATKATKSTKATTQATTKAETQAVTESAKVCYVSVEGYCSKKEIELTGGDTAYSVLKKTGASVSAENTQYGVYVAGINGKFEFDEGATSGWMYYVNGSAPKMSAGKYKVQSGDVVKWDYVKSY